MIDENFHQYGLYRLQLTRPQKVGYAIQVASMTNYSSMVRKVSILQDSFLRNILINIERGKDGNPDYRILIGAFANLTDANSYAKSLKKKNLDGFVINLSTLK